MKRDKFDFGDPSNIPIKKSKPHQRDSDYFENRVKRHIEAELHNHHFNSDYIKQSIYGKDE